MISRRKYLSKRYSTQSHKTKKKLNKILEIFINVSAVIIVIVTTMLLKNIFFPETKNINIEIENVSSLKIPYKTLNHLKETSIKNNLNFAEVVTYYLLENEFYPSFVVTPALTEIEEEFIANYETIKKNYNIKEVTPYIFLLNSIIEEIKYFPIPLYNEEEFLTYIFSDSWGATRTYGGLREHKGTDILSKKNVRGKIPIVSMTDGVVEKMGWNNLGGYSVGIRTESQNYFYYAHFSSFTENIEVGQKVLAGDILGYMGDTGYGEEGEKGQFPVHLHIGIRVVTELTNEEMWINPYPFLRYIENNKIDIRTNKEINS
jgi:peptidoglycan LD-endopeptidase LytH